MFESFCLNDPAAAFLELIKVGIFSFSFNLFSSLKLSIGIYTSPLISTMPFMSLFSFRGIFLIVLTL